MQTIKCRKMAELTLAILMAMMIAVNGKATQDNIGGLSEEMERGVVCGEKLGCFENKSPYDRMFLPDLAEEIATEFRFFYPGQKETPQLISNTNFSEWAKSDNGFDSSLKTVFIIHGFRGGNAQWPLQIKDALLGKESFNVFVVDWSKGATATSSSPFEYEKVVANTRMVGAEVGLFIRNLMKEKNLDPQNVHIIGHSLGSHVSGFAAKWIQQNETKVIGRITGLDPAGPRFYESAPAARLDRGDAEFVDIIHTNHATSRTSGFGLRGPIGHFDFYPNGGENQPGCKTASEVQAGLMNEVRNKPSKLLSFFVQFSSGKTQGISENLDAVSCSHERAYELFIASIKEPDCKFKSVQCDSMEKIASDTCGTCEDKCVSMGYYSINDKSLVVKDKSILFYLKTTKDSPYCLEKQ